jgi:hypothetical protein
MSLAATNNEADILSRVIDPDLPSLSEDAARSIIALSFAQQDQDRMNELAEKGRHGQLEPAEEAELNSYERVGCLLGILQSKARLSLKRAASSE